MRALRVTAPGEIAIVHVVTPKADGAGSPDSPAETILVRPLAIGLCGTDLEILDGSIDPAYVRYPITLGHEWVGELARAVTATAARAAIPAGARVVVEGIIPCARCRQCVRGDTQLCDVYSEIGFTTDGAAAELIAVPAAAIWRIDDSVPVDSAVVVEPAAVAWHAIALARPRAGDGILVIGDGTVGLLAARLARLTQPARVDMVGARPQQRPLAIRMGVDRFRVTADSAEVDGGAAQGTPDTPGTPHTPDVDRYDVVIVAAGSIAAAQSALTMVRRGGTVVLLGFPGSGQKIGVVVDDVVNNQISILGSFAYTREDWRTIVEGLNSGAIDLDGLVTHRFALDEFSAAITSLRSASGTRGKVVLHP